MTFKTFIFPVLLSSALLSAETHTAKDSKEDSHWDYVGKNDPAHWGDMKEAFSRCKNGNNQSPINLTGFIEAQLPPIEFNYHLASTDIEDNGHTEKVTLKAGSLITLDSITFELKQFHFHSPSENTIEGKSFPLEAHFVHASKKGELAVIAVMFEEGKANEGLTELWKNIPKKKGEHHEIHAKHLESLLPKTRDYYRFNGSLTTPPCTEGVRWLVMKKSIELSKAQIETFVNVMHVKNNRPIQATNARIILK